MIGVGTIINTIAVLVGGALGMGLGFLLGSFLAATFLSPLLGGWRNVLLLYGGVSVVFSLLCSRCTHLSLFISTYLIYGGK